MSKEMHELRDLSDKELFKRLKELKDEMIVLRAQHFQRKLDNPMALRNTRRSISRIHTLLREREGGA